MISNSATGASIRPRFLKTISFQLGLVADSALGAGGDSSGGIVVQQVSEHLTKLDLRTPAGVFMDAAWVAKQSWCVDRPEQRAVLHDVDAHICQLDERLENLLHAVVGAAADVVHRAAASTLR